MYQSQTILLPLRFARTSFIIRTDTEEYCFTILWCVCIYTVFNRYKVRIHRRIMRSGILLLLLWLMLGTKRNYVFSRPAVDPHHNNNTPVRVGRFRLSTFNRVTNGRFDRIRLVTRSQSASSIPFLNTIIIDSSLVFKCSDIL